MLYLLRRILYILFLSTLLQILQFLFFWTFFYWGQCNYFVKREFLPWMNCLTTLLTKKLRRAIATKYYGRFYFASWAWSCLRIFSEHWFLMFACVCFFIKTWRTKDRWTAQTKHWGEVSFCRNVFLARWVFTSELRFCHAIFIWVKIFYFVY